MIQQFITQVIIEAALTQPGCWHWLSCEHQTTAYQSTSQGEGKPGPFLPTNPCPSCLQPPSPFCAAQWRSLSQGHGSLPPPPQSTASHCDVLKEQSELHGQLKTNGLCSRHWGHALKAGTLGKSKHMVWFDLQLILPTKMHKKVCKTWGWQVENLMSPDLFECVTSRVTGTKYFYVTSFSVYSVKDWASSSTACYCSLPVTPEAQCNFQRAGEVNTGPNV